MQSRKSQVNGSNEYGTIAFITTPTFRKNNLEDIKTFVYKHFYWLCSNFKVLSTGGTYGDVRNGIISKSFGQIEEEHRKLIIKGMNVAIKDDSQLDQQWRQPILSAWKAVSRSFPGMIELAYKLLQGQIDAVIHLTDWQDMSAKPDSAALWRQANVHKVPFAPDIRTAEEFIASWKALIVRGGQLFERRKPPENPPLDRIESTHRVLAMIAHDAMKLELCRFAVECASDIFSHYDYILATGTTGEWLKKFMKAATKRPSSEVEKKIRCCLSGPKGGDIQIAYAVVKGLCKEVIFLQDPLTSHPHEADIRLFQQAVVERKVNAVLATNVESARLLLYGRPAS